MQESIHHKSGYKMWRGLFPWNRETCLPRSPCCLLSWPWNVLSSLLSCPAPGLPAAGGWVFWPGQCGNSLPPPLALSGHLYCTVLYCTVCCYTSRENKALVNTKAEILYTFCRCIVFFWLFTFYNAQQQKLYCFNNVQCTFMDLNSSSDFRLK